MKNKNIMKNKLDYYKDLNADDRQKYRAETVDFVMDLANRKENASKEVKDLLDVQINFSDKLLKEIGKVKEKHVSDMSDKEFLSGKWEYGGTRGERIDNWLHEVKGKIESGKMTKDKAIEEVKEMAKVNKDILEEDTKARMFDILAGEITLSI